MADDGTKKTSSGITLSGTSLLFLVGFSIIAAFFVGSLWTKVRLIEGDSGDKAALGAQNTNSESSEKETQEIPSPTITEDDHIRGNNQARIAMIEYTDVDCPYCQRFHSTAQQVIEAYPEDVMWVYNHFPIPSLHPDSMKKSEASECVASLAGEDAFWSFIDTLYENSPAPVDDLSTYAQNLGVDPNEFTACLDSGEFTQKIEDDQNAGISLGVQGTPSVLLYDTQTGDGTAFPGAVPFETLQEAIDAMLAS